MRAQAAVEGDVQHDPVEEPGDEPDGRQDDDDAGGERQVSVCTSRAVPMAPSMAKSPTARFSTLHTRNHTARQAPKIP